MLAIVFVFWGTVAVGASAATFARFDTATRTLLALFATFSWIAWAFGAYDIKVVTDNGVESFSYQSLAFLGFGAAIVMALFFVQRFWAVVQEQL